MSILAFLLVGLIAGWLASVIVEGRGLGGVGDMVVGIVGALFGGLIFNLMGVTAYGFWGAVAMSVIGAVVFLLIAGSLVGPRHIGKH